MHKPNYARGWWKVHRTLLNDARLKEVGAAASWLYLHAVSIATEHGDTGSTAPVTERGIAAAAGYDSRHTSRAFSDLQSVGLLTRLADGSTVTINHDIFIEALASWGGKRVSKVHEVRSKKQEVRNKKQEELPTAAAETAPPPIPAPVTELMGFARATFTARIGVGLTEKALGAILGVLRKDYIEPCLAGGFTSKEVEVGIATFAGTTNNWTIAALRAQVPNMRRAAKKEPPLGGNGRLYSKPPEPTRCRCGCGGTVGERMPDEHYKRDEAITNPLQIKMKTETYAWAIRSGRITPEDAIRRGGMKREDAIRLGFIKPETDGGKP